MAKSEQVFIRTTSGLVRNFSALDMILMATMAIFVVQNTVVQFPWYFGVNPGADLALGMFISFFPNLLLMLVYWAQGVVMPRAGSDYVWFARLTHPAVGFSWSLIYLFGSYLIYFVVIINVMAQHIGGWLGVWGLFYGVSWMANLGTWLQIPMGTFLFASLLTVVFVIIGVLGAKTIKVILYAGWVCAVIAMGTMWWLLATSNPAAFAAKWDMFFAQYVTYNGMFDLAKASGWVPVAVTFGATIAGLPMAMLFLFGGNQINLIAGEIRNVRKGLPFALILSLVLTTIIWIICTVTTLNAVGTQWMSAMGFMFDNHFGTLLAKIPYVPTQVLFLSLLAYPNQALISLLTVTFIVGSFPVAFLYMFFPTRYFFAWSFDRIIPTKLADVNARFRTPHNTFIASGGLGILLLALYLFAGFQTAYTMGVFVVEVAWAIISFVTAIFPFVKPELVDEMPTFMRKKLAGLPVISLISILSGISFTYISYLAWINPWIMTATSVGIEMVVGIVILGFVLYYLSHWYHKRRGIDISMAFKEIPPM